ncbi:uncharacterized protein LOC121977254 [Zingiber officinale]|uniref:uncharacterized protein LOC121977254 n=1 Tax=Zingiber officinale TaxID=94328 RepID=UPI001C4C8404|nr:uncharacterized protein LOC121977254 [Zingiber officinale]
MGVTPFHLVYGGEAVDPVEVGVESNWVQYYSEDNAERRLLELDFVDETRDKAIVDDLVWNKVKPVGDITKLEAPWAEPFKVVEKLYSGAYYLEDEDGTATRTSLEREPSLAVPCWMKGAPM